MFATVIALENPIRLDASVAAPGPHGFAVRDGLTRRLRPARPSHPAPTFGDDGQRPSSQARDGTVLVLIWGLAEAEYFCGGGLTRFLIIGSDLPVGLICRNARSRFDLPGKANQPGLVIPGCAVRRRPGIHNPRSWLWIPGSHQEVRPGMTWMGLRFRF